MILILMTLIFISLMKGNIAIKLEKKKEIAL